MALTFLLAGVRATSNYVLKVSSYRIIARICAAIVALGLMSFAIERAAVLPKWQLPIVGFRCGRNESGGEIHGDSLANATLVGKEPHP
jgi:hypothetical protein